MNEKINNYICPQLQIIRFETEDIVRTSGNPIQGPNELPEVKID